MSYKYIKMKHPKAFIIMAFLLSVVLGCDQHERWNAPKTQLLTSKESQNFESVIPKTSSSDERIITYWNACNFGNSKSEQTIDTMAQIVRNSHILVILEVSTSEAGARAVARLADNLNRKGNKWDYIVSEASSGNGSECVGILWQPARVAAKRNSARLLSDVALDIDREPFLFDFDIDGMILTVGGFHAVPTAKKPEREFAILSESQMMREKDCFIFGGDFNLPASKVEPYFAKLGFTTYIREKTSLGEKLHKDGSYLSKEYDHICTRGIEVISSGVASQLAYLDNDLARAKKISDHLPVWIKFRFSSR